MQRDLSPRVFLAENAQPLGGAVRTGGKPGMVNSFSPFLCVAGMDCKSARVYACIGFANRVSAGAVSTTLPEYITLTESQVCFTTARSCVTSMTAVPRSFCLSLIRSSTCFWTVTSSAVVGSSQMSSSGRVMSAIAIMTRCRIPPENSCG